MKFLLDMGISPHLNKLLRSLGHLSTHLHEEGLDELPDPAILDKARTEGAVLLTHDLDFADLLAASGDRLPSVVIFRLRDMRPERVGSYLEDLVTRHGSLLEQGAILSVTEGLVRVRTLPIEPR